MQRTRETKSQFGLKLNGRKENLKDAFMLKTNILLVDNILTTDSTLLEVANILKRNESKKVWGLTLARD